MDPFRVDSFSDPRVAAFGNVRDPDLLARHGLFVAEGRLVVRRLLKQHRFPVRATLVTEATLSALADLLPTHPGLPVYVVPQAVMNEVTGFDAHRGCLALGIRPAALPWQDLATAARRLVLLERVGNADNVGAVFRNAAAFGVDAILMGPGCADPLYRKAIRTSMGAALAVPFAEATPWPHALEWLRTDGWAVVALTPAPGARTLQAVVRSLGPRPVALLLGHEGDGVTVAAMAACSHQARIPMTPGVDSVNVATAAALALYEVTREHQG